MVFLSASRLHVISSVGLHVHTVHLAVSRPKAAIIHVAPPFSLVQPPLTYPLLSLSLFFFHTLSPSLPLSLPASLPASLPPSISVFSQQEGDIRLAGYGASRLAGRVEIYLDQQWVTVRDDKTFNAIAAKVVCRQLRLGHAVGFHGTPSLRSVIFEIFNFNVIATKERIKGKNGNSSSITKIKGNGIVQIVM